MRIVKFDPSSELPIVDARIRGRQKSRALRLVFDTGAGNTQIHTARIEAIGYSAIDALGLMSVEGPAGDSKQGYLISLKILSLFGKNFEDVQIGVYDFDNFAQYGFDGLLGFDVIKQLHLEMDGPKGVLKVF